MQIQYNITRIEEWCKSHEMPEGTLQLEHLMQAFLPLHKGVGFDWSIAVHRRRYRNHLRCLLDVEPITDPANVL
jgi:hypothetical protein